MNGVSFVDRDMVMRYFGGGIGHLKNAPPLQVPGFDPIDPSSKEMPVEDDDDSCSGTNEDLTAIVQQSSRDVVMNGGELIQLEVGEDDEDDEDNEEDNEDSDDDDEGGDQSDEDEDGEDEDDYGYASA
jgi:hypothetical protein